MLPPLNPLQAPNVICPSCGEIVPPTPTRETKKQPDGQTAVSKKITEIRYICVNPAKNCAWYVSATLVHVLGEGPFSLKDSERDQLREERKNLEEYSAVREKQMSELFAMLPRLRRILKELEPEGVDETISEIDPRMGTQAGAALAPGVNMQQLRNNVQEGMSEAEKEQTGAPAGR